MDYATMELPFGRHRNKPLFALPSHYLGWVLQNVMLPEPLLTAVQEEFISERRRGWEGYLPTTEQEIDLRRVQRAVQQKRSAPAETRTPPPWWLDTGANHW